MALLPYISDEKLLEIVNKVLILADAANNDEKIFYKNSVDPFSALFDAARQDITLSEWVERERARQGQKTLQNKLGEFHQAVLGSMPQWVNLVTGHVVDIKSDSKKIIAEIKNKHNTTKGSDKIVIYDELKFCLDNEYSGYTAYYVEIIPKDKKIYDKEFIPSDNKTSSRRESNPKIRVVDGKSFYTLASGYRDALKMLYSVLPQAIGIVLDRSLENLEKDSLFKILFDKTFA